MNKILKKIDDMRLARGWSVNNLAMEAMLTQSTLNNLYVREAEPKLSTLRSICNAFGITLSQFFADEENDGDLSEVDEKINELLPKLSYPQKLALFGLMKEMN